MNIKFVTASIATLASRVYTFASNPANMPQWAPATPFDVLDHVVTLPDGRAFNNPMRVIPNGAGSLVTFTLFRQDGMSGAEFERDAAMIESDLQALKRVVEALPD